MILSMIGLFGLGVFAWTFTEYAMHHWNGHLLKGKTRFSREHLEHHAKQDYFTPVPGKILLGATVLTSMGITGSFLIGIELALSFTAGFGLSYIGYEVLHYRIHFAAPRGWYGRWARKHHFSHHFNSPKMNHGVTSPIWDIVFGTYAQVDRVRVPRRRSIKWLVDPVTQECFETYDIDYKLVGKPRPS